VARGIGFHRHGEQVAYALVERRVESPPEVLAAGSCGLEEVLDLYRRLCAEHHVPWALAEERDGKRVAGPADDWPVARPACRAVVHPAVASAAWEWDLGRIQEDDIFLWLRPERLFWSRGEPGRAHAGVEARRGPLSDCLGRILSRVGGHGATVALASGGDAPGLATLEKALERTGCKVRPLKNLSAERGADRAAAGAALGALESPRPGFLPPVRTRNREPWLWTASFLAATAVGGSAWLAREQAQAGAFTAPSLPEEPPITSTARRPAPAPPELERLLARRRAVVRALETLAAQTPPGSLEELEVLTAPGSSKAQVRLRLLPRAEDEAASALEDPVAWTRSLPDGVNLETRVLEDGTTLIQGEVEPDGDER